jgi:carbon-monoxide dehydrogenase medium subunit
MAGGTDLVPLMKHEVIAPRHLISISRIEGIRKIERRDDKLLVGAGVTLADLITNEEIRRRAPVLSHTASLMASPQVRNLATIGGNISNSSPSADTPPSLIVLGAKFVLQKGRQKREVDAEAFFTGPGENVLEEGEILTEIAIPLRTNGFRAHYIKHTVKKGSEIAIVGAAVSAEFDEKGTVKEARIALGAVAPTPVRAREAEESLKGKKLTGEALRNAAALARETAVPIDDVRGSMWYRNEMVELLSKRSLEKLAEKE